MRTVKVAFTGITANGFRYGEVINAGDCNGVDNGENWDVCMGTMIVKPRKEQVMRRIGMVLLVLIALCCLAQPASAHWRHGCCGCGWGGSGCCGWDPCGCTPSYCGCGCSSCYGSWASCGCGGGYAAGYGGCGDCGGGMTQTYGQPTAVPSPPMRPTRRACLARQTCPLRQRRRRTNAPDRGPEPHYDCSGLRVSERGTRDPGTEACPHGGGPHLFSCLGLGDVAAIVPQADRRILASVFVAQDA